MKIREAGLEDAPFVRVCIELLHNEVPGGIIAPGYETLRYIRASVDQALGGQGLVLVAQDEGGCTGALLAVDAVFPYNTNLGKTVLGLGTYVCEHARKSGLASAL